MAVTAASWVLLWLVSYAVRANGAEDRFNYNATNWIQRNYGPRDWNLVQCGDVATCVSRSRSNQQAFAGTVSPPYLSFRFSTLRLKRLNSQPGWPTNYEALKPFIPYNGTKNTCKDCSSRRRGVCADHRQSPIPLNRNVTASRECIDRHLMKVRNNDARSCDAEKSVRRPVLYLLLTVTYSFVSNSKVRSGRMSRR